MGDKPMPLTNSKDKKYPKSPEDDNHKLLRVRVHKAIFARMKEIAKEQSEHFGEHISMSDIVRASIGSFIQVHETKKRIEEHLNEQK